MSGISGHESLHSTPSHYDNHSLVCPLFPLFLLPLPSPPHMFTFSIHMPYDAKLFPLPYSLYVSLYISRSIRSFSPRFPSTDPRANQLTFHSSSSNQMPNPPSTGLQPSSTGGQGTTIQVIIDQPPAQASKTTSTNSLHPFSRRRLQSAGRTASQIPRQGQSLSSNIHHLQGDPSLHLC